MLEHLDIYKLRDIVGNPLLIHCWNGSWEQVTSNLNFMESKSVDSEVALLCVNTCSHWQDPPQRPRADTCCVSSVSQLSIEGNFHFHVLKTRLYSTSSRKKPWNKMSHLIDEANEQGLTSVTLSQVIRFSLLISITHWHFVFLYFTRRVKERIDMQTNFTEF